MEIEEMLEQTNEGLDEESIEEVEIEKDENELIDVSQKATEEQVKTLRELFKEHPEYTYDEYAKLLNIGRATVARHIKKLNGTVIQRIGSDKDGYWEFIKD